MTLISNLLWVIKLKTLHHIWPLERHCLSLSDVYVHKNPVNASA